MLLVGLAGAAVSGVLLAMLTFPEEVLRILFRADEQELQIITYACMAGAGVGLVVFVVGLGLLISGRQQSHAA